MYYCDISSSWSFLAWRVVSKLDGKCLGPDSMVTVSLGHHKYGIEQCKFSCIKWYMAENGGNVVGCQFDSDTNNCHAFYGNVTHADGDTDHICWQYEWPGNGYLRNV